jgi:hypothetical protein
MRFINKAVCYVEPISIEQGEEQLDGGIDINKVKAFNNGDAIDGVCRLFKPSTLPVCDAGTMQIMSNVRYTIQRISSKRIHKFTWLLKGSHWTDFHEISYWEILLKSVEKNSGLVKIGRKYRELYM